MPNKANDEARVSPEKRCPHKIRARVSNEGCDTGCWIERGDSGIKLSDAGATYVAATIARPNHARGANAQ